MRITVAEVSLLAHNSTDTHLLYSTQKGTFLIQESSLYQ